MVEERVQSSQIQKEVECLNEDILKNLIDEDLAKLSSTEVRRMPITSQQSSQLMNQSTSTITSTDDEVLTETYYNGSK